MNIVRSRSMLGQFPGEGIASDITLGPQDSSITDNFPMYNDPGLLLAEQGATTAAPAPSTTVPQPPSAPSPVYATFGPAGTTVPSLMTAATQPVSPAPRVNIPLTTPSGFLSSNVGGIPMIAVLGIGLLGILALSGGKGRRR